MEYRQALSVDIPGVEELQRKYHISSIREEDLADGFVTTLFTEAQFQSLIEKENGLFIAVDDGKIIGYAMAASWEYWKDWPLFQYMIEELDQLHFCGETMTIENSYQYGPVCIDAPYRGKGVLAELFEFHRRVMRQRYPYMITFINQKNPRSFAAHEKIGLEVLRNFEFGTNSYFELGYDMDRATIGCDPRTTKWKGRGLLD